jgi:dihydrofolate reductase
MAKLIYSMGVSLDGFIAAPGGDIGWGAPDEELHQHHNDQIREIAVHLLGRRLYETMVYWETAHENPEASPIELEFAGLWQPLRKIVYSTTLDGVVGNTTLERAVVADEIVALKEQAGGDVAVGGAGLAATLLELGLVDECRLYISPVVLGAGTPFFPPLRERIELELVETRTFASRVVYVRYRM